MKASTILYAVGKYIENRRYGSICLALNDLFRCLPPSKTREVMSYVKLIGPVRPRSGDFWWKDKAKFYSCDSFSNSYSGWKRRDSNTAHPANWNARLIGVYLAAAIAAEEGK